MNNIMDSNQYLPILWSLVAVVLIFCLFLIIFLASNKKKQLSQISFLKSFTEQFKPTLGIEKNLDFILLKTQELVVAPSYSFYIYNPTNQRYTLKTVRQLTSDANIAPSYSGLLPYEKEKYDPPLSLSKDSYTEQATITKAGEVPILSIPIKGGTGIIRIGPIAKVSSKTIKNFNQLSNLLEVPLKNLIEEEDQRRNYEVLETSSKSVKYINRLFVHEVEYIRLVVQTYMKSTKPTACLVVESNSTNQKVAFSNGIGNEIIQNINSNRNIIGQIRNVTENKAFSIFQDTSIAHSKLNQYLSLTGGGYFVICQFALLNKQYMILFSFKQDSSKMELTRNQAIKMLWSQIQQFIQIKQNSTQGSISYIDFLKSVADLMDQASPFTVGSSKLMANYSMVIAKEMGLPAYQIQSIGLAAYLSNIGIIGLSDGLLNKDGVYSDKEYEQMKLHSEVGAAIIENTIAQDDVALYVKHHHERMDGNGYPSRLAGDNIPVGSRIIAVVQTFLAKINGRSYRDPLSFDDALNLVKNSAGSQLDSKIVAVFLGWYESKRNSVKGNSRAIGNCWDLCCVPASICSQCPAYKSTKNCWEHESNNCRAHGKTCETCFVYTEAMSRIGREKVAVV